MKKFIVLFMLVCVLRVPVEIWGKAPEHERERVRTLATIEHCEKEAKRTGETKFKIWETIKNGQWELHIVSVKTHI